MSISIGKEIERMAMLLAKACMNWTTDSGERLWRVGFGYGETLADADAYAYLRQAEMFRKFKVGTSRIALRDWALKQESAPKVASWAIPNSLG
jgi:hypothetical protein